LASCKKDSQFGNRFSMLQNNEKRLNQSGTCPFQGPRRDESDLQENPKLRRPNELEI